MNKTKLDETVTSVALRSLVETSVFQSHDTKPHSNALFTVSIMQKDRKQQLVIIHLELKSEANVFLS